MKLPNYGDGDKLSKDGKMHHKQHRKEHGARLASQSICAAITKHLRHGNEKSKETCLSDSSGG